MPQRILSLFYLLLVNLYVAPAFGAEAFEILPNLDGEKIASRFAYYEDKTATLTVEDISQEDFKSKFMVYNYATFNFGFSDSVYWFKLEEVNRSNKPIEWVMEINEPLIEYLTLYTYDDKEGKFSATKSGAKQVRDNDTFSHRASLFTLTAAPGSARTYYLRVASGMPLNFVPMAWSKENFWEFSILNNAWLGLLAGVFISMTVYNFMLYFSVGDRNYLYYSLYGLFMGSLTALYLGPGRAVTSWLGLTNPENIYIALCYGSYGLYTLFTLSFLEVDRYYKKWAQIMTWLIVSSIFLGITNFVIDYPDVLLAGYGMSAEMTLLIWLVIALLIWKKGHKFAIYYVFAQLSLLTGIMISFTKDLGFFIGEWVVINALATGAAVEMILLSLALGAKIKDISGEKIKFEKMANQERTRASNILIDSQEGERTRIAGDLHDGVGQNLIVSSHLVKSAIKENGNGRADKLWQTVELLDKTMEDTRSIIQDLRPHMLDRLGLTEAISNMADTTFKAAEIKADIKVDNIDSYVESSAAIHLYRIVQEAITNAIKYSNASHVRVTGFRSNGKLKFSISDNGVGLTASDANSEGYGIKSMRARVRFLNGSFEIANHRGVSVNLTIPVNERHD